MSALRTIVLSLLLGLAVAVVNIFVFCLIFAGPTPWETLLFWSLPFQVIVMSILGAETLTGISLLTLRRAPMVGNLLVSGAFFTLIAPMAWCAFAEILVYHYGV